MRSTTRTSASLLAAAALGLAACGGGDSSGDTGGDTTGGEAASLTVVAGDLFYEYDGTQSGPDTDLTIPVAAGEVSITLDNQGVVLHNLVIESLDEKVAEADGEQSASGTVTLESGSYVFYCDVEGHREAGMEGTFQAG